VQGRVGHVRVAGELAAARAIRGVASREAFHRVWFGELREKAAHWNALARAFALDAGAVSYVAFDDRLGFVRSIPVPSVPLAVAASSRRELPSLFVADGARVYEIGLPVPSPVPVVESLRARLAAADAEGALELIHPQQRRLFREIYEDIAADLALDASVMESFEVDYLREGVAIVRIRRSDAPGLTFPVYLVRAEDGTWQIFDY
jgi:hypothetical protein